MLDTTERGLLNLLCAVSGALHALSAPMVRSRRFRTCLEITRSFRIWRTLVWYRSGWFGVCGCCGQTESIHNVSNGHKPRHRPTWRDTAAVGAQPVRPTVLCRQTAGPRSAPGTRLGYNNPGQSRLPACRRHKPAAPSTSTLAKSETGVLFLCGP